MCQGALSLLSLLVLSCVTAAVYAESKCPWILADNMTAWKIKVRYC